MFVSNQIEHDRQRLEELRQLYEIKIKDLNYKEAREYIRSALHELLMTDRWSHFDFAFNDMLEELLTKLEETHAESK